MSLIVTHRGSVNTWECDENAHLNVRFHIAKAHEGLSFLLEHAGHGPARRARDGTTAILVQDHVRFHREARVAMPITIRGGVVGVNDGRLVLYSEARHSLTNVLFTTFLHEVALQDDDGTRSTIGRVDAATCTPPPEAQPRGLTAPPTPARDAATLAALGYAEIGRGTLVSMECDGNGRMYPHTVAGRVSDSVINLMALLQTEEEIARRSEGTEGGAVVEYRILYDSLPAVGTPYTVHSGIRAVGAKTQHLEHRMIDAATGASVARCDVVAVAMDLATRRAVAFSDERRVRMAERLLRDVP